jgi:hypothetical protein
VYDAAYRRIDDCSVNVEDFQDYADELMQQLDYAGYDCAEYVGLSDLNRPAARRCGERCARTGVGCGCSAGFENRLESRGEG